MTNRGRPREHTDAAGKQRAYRERKRDEQARIRLALDILEQVEEQANEIIVTLQKGGSIEVSTSTDFAMIYWSNGSSIVNWYTVQHLIRTGQLEKAGQDFLRTKYKLVAN